MRKKSSARGRKGKKRILFLFVLLVLLVGTVAREASAAGVDTTQEIRVGLKNKFAGKKSITIRNKKMELGYCDGREYRVETVLSSGSGIQVTPEKGSFFAVEDRMSLAEAESLAMQLMKAGVNAYAVLLSYGQATVYCPVEENGGEEKEVLKQCMSAAKGMDISFEDEAKSSVYLICIQAEDRILFADGANGDYPQFAPSETDEDSLYTVDLGSHRYRGRLEIGRYGGRTSVTAVNVVPLEGYLYGVVPYEMPATWPMEALKAQAVCARSYALLKAGYHAETDIKRGYRMVDTVQSQVYGGTEHEHARSNAAVDATKGQTLCYENRTVAGYYFSASGGHTEDVEDVWGSEKTYLQGVPDIYEQNPSKEPWRVSITGSRLESLLKAEGKEVGKITKVVPEIATASGRVYRLRVIGSEGSVTLATDELRNVLDLPSTKFKVISAGATPDAVTVQGEKESKQTRISDCYVIGSDGEAQSAKGLTEQYVVVSEDNLTGFSAVVPKEGEFLFVGMGHGHGVGMSQSGARGMADRGFTYQEILEHYFTGISVR